MNMIKTIQNCSSTLFQKLWNNSFRIILSVSMKYCCMNIGKKLLIYVKFALPKDQERYFY